MSFVYPRPSIPTLSIEGVGETNTVSLGARGQSFSAYHQRASELSYEKSQAHFLAVLLLISHCTFPIRQLPHDAEEFENAASFLRLGLASTLIRHETELF